MREGKLETEVGQIGTVAILGILLWAFVFRDKTKKKQGNTAPPSNGNVGTLEVRGLSVGTQAQSPLRATSVSFEHKGPENDVVLGLAAKPDGAIWGVNFNNGDNVVDPFWAFAHFTIPASATWRRHTEAISVELQEPTAGLYTARGGSTREFIEPVADVWIWLSSKTEIWAAGLSDNVDELMDERFIKVIDTDANIMPVHSPAVGARSLAVSWL